MAEYTRAPEVQEIAERLIHDVDMHKNLAEARIEYVWRDKASKSKGRIILAKARKVGGLNAWLANASEQRVALVDHELCHCWVEMDAEGNPELGTRGHDLEEFSCIVERHGLWKGDVDAFGREALEADARFLDDLGIKEPGEDDPES